MEDARKNNQTSRTDRKRAQRIERVERAAASVFARNGYDGANFELIAAELDLRGPSLYYYFSSKDELFLRCIRKSAKEVFARLQKIIDSDLKPEYKLRNLFYEQVLIEVRDYPEFVPLFFKTQVPIPELRKEVLNVRRDHAFFFEQVAEEWRTQSMDKIARTHMRVRLGIAFGALAYIPDWYNPKGELTLEQLAEELSEALLDLFIQYG